MSDQRQPRNARQADAAGAPADRRRGAPTRVQGTPKLQSPRAWSQAAEPQYAPAPPQAIRVLRRPAPAEPHNVPGSDLGGPVPPARPPQRVPAAAPRPRRRRKHHPFRWLLALLLVLVVAGAGFAFHLDGKLNRIDALSASSTPATVGTNWLLIGSDSRAGLTPEQEAALATGGEVGPSRTDSIMLVHIPRSGKATMVSLPRDSYVPIAGYGRDKLNAAFAFGGAPLLVSTVESATGVHIDHYAEIGFGGFADLVDAMGGIDLCITEPMVDPLAGLALQPGCQTLDGTQSLGYVRTRATPRADLDRMIHQREFMSALFKKAATPTTWLNPLHWTRIPSAAVDSLTVDNGDHLWDLARLAWALRGGVTTTTVPIGSFGSADVGSIVTWDRAKASALFDAIARDEPIPADVIDVE